MTADSQNLFETMPGLFIVLTPELQITMVSNDYLSVARKERSEVVGQYFFDVFPHLSKDSAGNSEDMREILEGVVRTGLPKTTLSKRLNVSRPGRESGETTFWKSVNFPVVSPDGVVTSIIRRVDDVTDVVLQEQEWKTTERERDLFFEHSFDAMVIVGPDGFFKKVNPAFERALGYSAAELLASPLMTFLHPEDVKKTTAGIRVLSGGSERIASVNRYRCKDGTYKSFSWNTTPLGTSFYSVGRDITEQLAAEERIRALNLELESKNEDLEKKIEERLAELKGKDAQVQQLQKLDAVGRLAGGIAHDFNNILAAIQIYCDLVASRATEQAVVQNSVKQIEKATARGAALTRQLLIFSRKKVAETQAVHLNLLLKDHFKMLDRLIGEKIKVEFKLADDLPLISADPGQLEQIILNLALNARDAMPDGGKMAIETRFEILTEKFASTHLSSKLGPHLVLSVTDTGCGMDEKTRAQLFEPFFTTKPVGKGTGLGLSTVYGIVKSLEGTIWVYSEPGKGTVFKIYIPATNVVAERAPEAAPRMIVGGNEKVLIAEDDPNLRELYGSAMTAQGYRVILAANGKEALEALKIHSDVSLIVTDMVMPQLGGGAIASAVLGENADVKILLISGYPGEESDAKLFENERVAYLQKPFNTAALLRQVRELLEAPVASGRLRAKG